MSVFIDQQPVDAGALGLATVGHVLGHVQKEQRLVVQVLLDGRKPNLEEIGALRQMPLEGHVLYVETADPRALALEVLEEMDQQLSAADPLRAEAADLLDQGQISRAMQKLSGCFAVWHHAQDAVVKTSQLLRLDLQQVACEGQPIGPLLRHFADQLKQVRSALEQRDFVLLGDMLRYEMTDACHRWRRAIDALRQAVQSLR